MSVCWDDGTWTGSEALEQPQGSPSPHRLLRALDLDPAVEARLHLERQCAALFAVDLDCMHTSPHHIPQMKADVDYTVAVTST